MVWFNSVRCANLELLALTRTESKSRVSYDYDTQDLGEYRAAQGYKRCPTCKRLNNRKQFCDDVCESKYEGDISTVYGIAAQVKVKESPVTNYRGRCKYKACGKGGPQEYAVSLSLSQGQTLQLVAGMADSLQNASSAVAPNVFGYQFQSRNKAVATVSATGLVTPVGRGGVGVLIGNPRAVNASFGGATPAGWSGTRGNVEGTYAELQVTVLP